MALAAEFPNVIVSRTASKSFSLAGLRFGYAVAHPEIIAGLNKLKDSYNLDMLTQTLARAAVRAIAGLRGYVGVDLVLGEDAVRCIEINPRLTTSYIALRRVARLNLAHSIRDACMAGKLPESFPLSGEAVIRKDNPNSWGWVPRAGRHESP